MNLMSRLRACAAIAFVCAVSASAQYTTVTTTHLGGASGITGTIYWQPVVGCSGGVGAARIGASSGQLSGIAVAATVTAGASSVSIPDALVTTPNIAYAVTAVDVNDNIVIGNGLQADSIHVAVGGAYGCVQPTGTTWNLDTYVPNIFTPVLPSSLFDTPTTTTGAPGSSAAVTLTPVSGQYHFAFTIPQGLQGPSGLGVDPLCATDSNGHLTCKSLAVTDLTSTGNVALKYPKEQGVQSVQFVGSASLQGCSNANDGRSWGTCVADITQAWKNLMNLAPGFGGTIYMIGGGACGGPQNALWVMGPFDKAWAIITASVADNGNGTSTMTVTNIGTNVGGTPTLSVGETLYDAGTVNLPYATITALGTGTGGNGTYIISGSYTLASQTIFGVPPNWLPQIRAKIIGMPGGHFINPATQALAIPCSTTVTPNLWFTGTNVNFKITDIGNETGPQSLWLGIDSVTLGSSTTQGFEFRNDFLRLLPTQPITAGPAVTIGGQVTNTHFYNMSINANSSSGRAIDGSDSTQAIVTKPGAQFSLDDSVIQYGDILYRDGSCAATGPNPGQLDIHNLRQLLNMDGKGAVWIPSQLCANVNIDNLQVVTVQSPTTSAPAVEIDTSAAPAVINLNNIEGKVTSGTAFVNFVGSPMPNIHSQAGGIGTAFAMGSTYGPNVVDSSGNIIWGMSRQAANLIPFQSFAGIALCPNQQAGGFYSTPANCSVFDVNGSNIRALSGNYAATTFASLPTCSGGTGAGSFYGITDAVISGTANAITGGGGTAKGQAYCDGSGWHLVWSYNVSTAAPTITRWMSPWTGNTGAAPILNTVRGWGFTLPVSVTFSTLTLISNLADASLYSAAIANTSGTLLCHPTTGTAISTANAAWDNTCSEGAVTLSPGTYILLYTGNSTTGKVQSAAINTVVGPFFSNSIAGCSSASGVISGTCTISTSSAVYGTGIPSFSLH